MARVREVSPDFVLVIRGDVLTEEFWALAAENDRLVGVWMYDEIRRTNFDADLVGRYAQLATYSAQDAATLRAAGHRIAQVPLGFDASSVIDNTTAGAGLVSFVGAPLPKREHALAALVSAGVPVQAWGRGWSDHVFDRARTWRVRSLGIPARRDVAGPSAHAIMRNGRATLNIHGDQDGFTMRTFEAAGVGAVQIIDRADVADFYDPGEEILVYDGHEELVDCLLAKKPGQRPADGASVATAARALMDGDIAAAEAAIPQLAPNAGGQTAATQVIGSDEASTTVLNHTSEQAAAQPAGI
ncbi:MAG: hypothetical protein DI618_10695, partial [Dermacoccus nishinomiyaensis]